MSKIPQDLRYTASHEWVRVMPDGNFSIGITDHAQLTLGDLVFIELPEIGMKAIAGKTIAVVESVKAAADIYSPVDGEISEINTALIETPELVNKDSYENWLFRIKPLSSDLDNLLDAAGYRAEIGE